MIPHSEAFGKLKQEAQTLFDFAILISYSIPALKKAMKGGGALPFRPDYFDVRPINAEKVKQSWVNYKSTLSKYIFLSTFSYFEAYFVDILLEIIKFHGDDKILEKLSIQHNVSLIDDETKCSKRKLQEYKKSSNMTKYKLSQQNLSTKGYRFPLQLLSKFGIKQLIDAIKNEKIKAKDIPLHLEELLQMSIDPKIKEQFHNFRETRNKIAHGKASSLNIDLKKAIEANHFLRELALMVDKHVIEHFFVIE